MNDTPERVQTLDVTKDEVGENPQDPVDRNLCRLKIKSESCRERMTFGRPGRRRNRRNRNAPRRTPLSRKREPQVEKLDCTPRTRYQKLGRPRIEFAERVKEKRFDRLQLADQYGDIGRAQRALRFKNLTDAVARRFKTPELSFLLLGMFMEESMGNPVMPNLPTRGHRYGDGGLGALHMQPGVAKGYGLRTIDGSEYLIDRTHARRIKEAIERFGGDMKRLTALDDRFNPLISIDAAARKLCDDFGRKGWWGAMVRYAGRGRYPSRVFRFAALLKDGNFMKRVSDDFAKRNSGLPFEQYTGAFAEMNRNFGLDQYRKLDQIDPPR